MHSRGRSSTVGRSPSHPLRVLGLTSTQEDLYRGVLQGPTGLAELQRHPADLDRLLSLRLVSVVEDQVVAEPPDIALGRVIGDETRRLRAVGDQIESLRNLLPAFVEEHRRSGQEGQPLLGEVLHGDTTMTIRQLALDADGDCCWLRPDQWRLPSGPAMDALILELAGRGRRSRAIYPARVLEESPKTLQVRAEAGEQVRILAQVPSRLAVMGTHAAVITERWEVPVDDGAPLVVRHHGLIGALRQYFDRLWDRAMPVPGLGQGEIGRADWDRRLLLEQLVSGAKDEQVARALGIGLRTVRRRVASLLEELGVESRFAAGAEAVRRGWI